MSIAALVLLITNYLYLGVYAITGLCGLVGAIMVLMTREDAFRAADRQPKMIWALMLFGSAAVLLLPLPGLSMLTWVCAVIIGLYWFDVRPQIKNILSGNYGW